MYIFVHARPRFSCPGLPRTAKSSCGPFFPLVCWRGGLVCHDAPNCSASMAAERMDELTRCLGREAQRGRVCGRNREDGWRKGRCFGEERSLSLGQGRGRDRRPNGIETWERA